MHQRGRGARLAQLAELGCADSLRHDHISSRFLWQGAHFHEANLKNARMRKTRVNKAGKLKTSQAQDADARAGCRRALRHTSTVSTLRISAYLIERAREYVNHVACCDCTPSDTSIVLDCLLHKLCVCCFLLDIMM